MNFYQLSTSWFLNFLRYVWFYFGSLYVQVCTFMKIFFDGRVLKLSLWFWGKRCYLPDSLSLFLCLRESKNDLKLPSLEIINECQHDKRRHRFPGAKQEIRKWTNKNWSKKLQRKWGVVKVHCNLRLFHFTDFFCNHNHKIVNHQDFYAIF